MFNAAVRSGWCFALICLPSWSPVLWWTRCFMMSRYEWQNSVLCDFSPLLSGWQRGKGRVRELGKLKVNFKIFVELPVCSIWKALIVSLGNTGNNLLSSLEIWINLKCFKWIGLKHFLTYHSRYLNSGELVQLPFYLLSLLSSLAISPSHMLQDE